MPKKTIRLNKTQLCKMIMEDVVDWKKNNDELYKKAINMATEYVLQQIDDSICKNATDLQQIDSNLLQWFFAFAEDEGEHLNTDEPFRISDLYQRYHHVNYPPVFEDIVEENIEDIFPDDLLDAIYDRIDVGSIINKHAYGGGGYEVKRWLCIDTAENVTQRIKNKYSTMKNTIKLTESDLHRIVKESVHKVMKESSYDSMGNFDTESHNNDLKARFTEEIQKLNECVGHALSSLDLIAKMASGVDDEIEKRARIVMNALIKANREIRNVNQLISADRWDLPA